MKLLLLMLRQNKLKKLPLLLKPLVLLMQTSYVVRLLLLRKPLTKHKVN
jgi:hypothetical protein